ncbi:LOW QUALITY PROTEIN: hypothetical protein U0070_016666, partial [Myodes glareolus]
SALVFGCKKTATVVVHCKQMPPGDDGVTHAAVQVTGARSASEQGAICWCDYPGPGPGGGFAAQIYVILQSISKVLVAYCQKYVGEASKKEIKDILTQYDWPLLVGDPCRCESRKFRGHGAHAQHQKPY